MLLELLASLVSVGLLVGAAGLLAGAVGVFALTVAKTIVARHQLTKRTGLKLLDEDFSIWAGNINSISFGRANLYKISAAFKRLNVNTMGFLFGSRQTAISIDLELIKRIALDNMETDRMKSDSPIREMEVDSIFTAEGEQWHRIRRAIAPALRSNKFKAPNVQREIENSIGKLVAAIERKLEAAQGDEVELDVDDWMHRFQLDLVLNCFYKQDNLVDFHAQLDPMTATLDAGLRALQSNPLARLPCIFPVLQSPFDWLMFWFHPQGVWRRMLMQFIKQQTRLNLEARKQLELLKRSGKSVEDEDCFTLQDGTQFRRNMIDHVIDQFHEGKLTKSEYFHSTWGLVTAANKTTSDAITHTIYQLAVHCEVQDKLRKSIQSDGAESEYLSWTINESLRLLPPASIGCSRMTSRDYKCQDGLVPAGTFVSTPTYTIHRLEQYWGGGVEDFKPERFANTSHFHPAQFMPFGAGARVCPGREFALHETRKLLAELLSRYQFRCEPLDIRYDSPMLMFLVPNRHVVVRVSRV